MQYPNIEWPYTNVHQLNLDWVIDTLKKVLAALKEQMKNIESNTDRISQLESQVAQIEQFIADFNAGKLDDLYKKLLWQWMIQYMPEVVAGIVRYVVFGLTSDGYFCAYIPTNWDFITFDTIAQGPLFGHLVLKW